MGDLSGIVDIYTVKRTELVGDNKNIVSIVFDSTDRASDDPVDTNSTELEPAEQWQQYGFISRPPKGSQAAAIRDGSTFFAFASRAIVAAKVFGQLVEGDVALFATLGNMIKLGADGSIVFRVPTDGDQDIILAISGKDGGSLKFIIPGGPAIEWSKKNGITHNAGDKNLTNATTQKIQNIGAMMVDEVGVHKLHMGATIPLVGIAALAPGAPNVFI